MAKLSPLSQKSSPRLRVFTDNCMLLMLLLDPNNIKASLTHHYTKDIPDVEMSVIMNGLGQLKNKKGPGEDGINAELLKAGGLPALRQLKRLSNSVTHKCTTPEAWNRSIVVLLNQYRF